MCAMSVMFGAEGSRMIAGSILSQGHRPYGRPYRRGIGGFLRKHHLLACDGGRAGLSLVHLIQTSIYDEYSGTMKITTHLDHISHCKTASGTNGSKR